MQGSMPKSMKWYKVNKVKRIYKINGRATNKGFDDEALETIKIRILLFPPNDFSVLIINGSCVGTLHMHANISGKYLTYIHEDILSAKKWMIVSNKIKKWIRRVPLLSLFGMVSQNPRTLLERVPSFSHQLPRE